MTRWSQREIVLLMAREIDDTDPECPEDDDYIAQWVPAHSCGGAGDPTCAACWLQSYDAVTALDKVSSNGDLN